MSHFKRKIEQKRGVAACYPPPHLDEEDAEVLGVQLRVGQCPEGGVEAEALRSLLLPGPATFGGSTPKPPNSKMKLWMTKPRTATTSPRTPWPGASCRPPRAPSAAAGSVASPRALNHLLVHPSADLSYCCCWYCCSSAAAAAARPVPHPR